jgi:thioredoxin 1
MIRFINFCLIFSFALFANCQTNSNKQDSKNAQIEKKGEVIVLSDQTFKEKIFDYVNNKEWKYKGSIPCIVDFYADWCGPCRRVSPILEQAAKDYAGKLIIYKVNTDKEQLLSTSLGITSLPTILFVPATGKPQVLYGAYPKETIIKVINDILLIKKQ